MAQEKYRLSRKTRTCEEGCTYLQGRMQCTAGADAVHCKGGCSALHLRGEKLALKSSVLFWTGEKGGKTHSIWVIVAPRKFLLNPRYSKQESPGRTTIAHSGPMSTHP